HDATFCVARGPEAVAAHCFVELSGESTIGNRWGHHEVGHLSRGIDVESDHDAVATQRSRRIVERRDDQRARFRRATAGATSAGPTTGAAAAARSDTTATARPSAGSLSAADAAAGAC